MEDTHGNKGGGGFKGFKGGVVNLPSPTRYTRRPVALACFRDSRNVCSTNQPD